MKIPGHLNSGRFQELSPSPLLLGFETPEWYLTETGSACKKMLGHTCLNKLSQQYIPCLCFSIGLYMDSILVV